MTRHHCAETDLFVAWFEEMLLRRLQLRLHRLLGVFCGRVRQHLGSGRLTLVLLGRAGLVRESRSGTVGHGQLAVLLLRLRLLLRLLLLRLLLLLLRQLLDRRALFGLTEVCVRRVQEEVPALRANLGGRGRGWSVNGAL